MIKGYSKTKNLPAALKIFRTMRKDSSVQPNNVTFNSLLDCAVRCDDLKTAEEVFNDM